MSILSQSPTKFGSKSLFSLDVASWSLPLSLLVVVLFSVLTAIAAKIAFPVPGTPVPITLQSFLVMMAGIALGSKRGAASQIGLIGLGLGGLPVFSAALPGTLVLMGPTGGYILGFIPAAFVTGLFFEKLPTQNFVLRFLGIFAISFLILIPGAIWLSVYTGGSFTTAVTTGIVPFLAGDVVKCLMATTASYALSVKR